MDDETEVLIAGAGPVGLALALELQRLGIRFRIVEKNAERLSDPAQAVRATTPVRQALAARDELSRPKSLRAFRCTVLAGSRPGR